MLLSVIIVNYNVRALLLNAIASLRVALKGLDAEIIVVDNASTDGAMEALERQCPDVLRIPLDENLGFGKANNIGIGRAAGEYILLLNPDTIVQEDTVQVMLDLMREHPEIGFSGCKILLPDGTFDPACKRGFPSPWSSFCKVFGLSRLFPKSKLFGGYNLTYMDLGQAASIDALQGCFMFCRADLLKELNGFDPDYFMYGEDLDLCYRARKRGWEVYYTPDTSIIHLKGESTKRGSMDALAVFYEAMEVFARKHFRYNLPLLLLVRSGIWLRRTLARIHEGFPAWWFALIDALAIMLGFAIGSLIKFHNVFYYPGYAVPWVYLAPPLVFLMMIALAGGYDTDDRAPVKSLFGYMLGLFALSTLTYFFKDYAFSRGIVLVIAGTGVVIGVAGRFLWLLYRKTFGAESIRRIAFLAQSAPSPELRNGVRRMFLGKPVVIVGTVTPSYADADRMGPGALGAVESIATIARTYRLTDVFVVDSSISYGQTLRAMNILGGRHVRFHIAPEALQHTVAAQNPGSAPFPLKNTGSRALKNRKHLRDRLIAAFGLLFLWPVVYLFSKSPKARLNELAQVIAGRRSLVGGGADEPPYNLPAVFSAAALCRDESLTRRELADIETYYLTNRSLLLDCEIIIATLRQRGAPVAGQMGLTDL